MTTPLLKKSWRNASFILLLTAAVSFNACKDGGSGTTIKLSEAEFKVLASDYSSLVDDLRIKDETKGGQLSRKTMHELVNSINEEERMVHFRYGIDPSTGKTTLIFRFRITNADGTTSDVFLRNGGSEDSFCPSVCGITEADLVSVNSNQEEYERMNEMFRERYSGLTMGGAFDTEALKTFVNDVPETNINLGFRFCIDPEFGQKSVILVGAVGEDGAMYFIRNGGSVAAFCPIHCDSF